MLNRAGQQWNIEIDESGHHINGMSQHVQYCRTSLQGPDLRVMVHAIQLGNELLGGLLSCRRNLSASIYTPSRTGHDFNKVVLTISALHLLDL